MALCINRRTVGWLLFGLLLSGQGSLNAQGAKTAFEISATKFLLGTQVDITVFTGDVQAGREACYAAFKEIERVERRLSSHLETSEIAAINREAALRPVRVSGETFSILTRALKYSRTFNGLFDVTIGPLSREWGFNGSDAIQPPDSLRIQALLRLVNYRNMLLNHADSTVFFAQKGMRIDLGGIAKGYAIDRAAKILKDRGIGSFLINAGGDIYASGRKPDGSKWIIGIKHPRKPQALLAAFELSDFAVATSGDYERFVIVRGKRYHHILDPRTGYPATGSQSATVLAPTAEKADVLATYLFILGFSAFQDAFPHPAPPALLVDASGKVYYSPELKKGYHLRFFEEHQ